MVPTYFNKVVLTFYYLSIFFLQLYILKRFFAFIMELNKMSKKMGNDDLGWYMCILIVGH